MSKKKEKEHGYDDGSYVTKKSRKFSLFAFILCLLIAFVIWIYATNKVNQSTTEDGETTKESLYTETCPDTPSNEWL